MRVSAHARSRATSMVHATLRAVVVAIAFAGCRSRRVPRTLSSRERSMRVIVAVGLLVSDAAWAGGFSADIELVHPTFAGGSVPGIDEVRRPEHRDVRVGFVAQYQRNPLILRNAQRRL